MSENLKELYLAAEKEVLSKPAKGEKAELVRATVIKVAKETGKNRISQAAIFRILKTVYPDTKFDRSQVTSAINSAWTSEKDDAGTVWVLVDKPVKKE